MKKPIILIGGGGHCISCIDVLEETGQYEIQGILDMPEKVGKNILHYPVIGTDDDIERLSDKCKNFLITVGQIENYQLRKMIFSKVKNAGGQLPVIISPTAYVSKYAEIKEGTVIMHRAVVNAMACIGKACIINTNALIEHEAEVGNFCHISTSANVNGQVKIGNYCFVGSNTIVANNLKVSDEAVIAAGSQVLRDIKSGGVYLGHPLRKIR